MHDSVAIRHCQPFNKQVLPCRVVSKSFRLLYALLSASRVIKNTTDLPPPPHPATSIPRPQAAALSWA